MLHSVKQIKQNNPKFNYQLFDDNDCRQFIQDNFDASILNAYDSLIPGAYKADLWRYCILYKKGGIYLDIKYSLINNFKFITMTEKEHWVLDADNYGIYNALMICLPGNNILLQAINKIVEHVNQKYYGEDWLDPTGPGLLKKMFSEQERNNFDMKHTFYKTIHNRFIIYNGYHILKSYSGYLDEYDKTKKTLHYSQLWSNKQIYK